MVKKNIIKKSISEIKQILNSKAVCLYYSVKSSISPSISSLVLQVCVCVCIYMNVYMHIKNNSQLDFQQIRDTYLIFLLLVYKVCLYIYLYILLRATLSF